MRYKVVPEPLSKAELLTGRDALPLVPGSVEDCCTRIRDATPLASRDAARELLTFLQALGLATETPRGYYRDRSDPSTRDLAEAFLDGVFGAREVVSALRACEEPMTVDDAFGVIREDVPKWERDRHTDWESEWHERVERLLAWAVTFELVAATDEGYVAVTE